MNIIKCESKIQEKTTCDTCCRYCKNKCLKECVFSRAFVFEFNKKHCNYEKD